MEDSKITQMLFDRNEDAISALESKYSRYLKAVASNILDSPRDEDECLNDTYLAAWNSIPPENPSCLKAYLAKLVRNSALSKFRARNAQKRGGSNTDAVFEELDFAVASTDSDTIDRLHLRNVLNEFLCSLSEDNRTIFIQRYFYFCEISQIARGLNISEGKVKMSLTRSRKKLKEVLTENDITL